mmetsp:Transcript_2515/g.5598  ORF Transcript_2515/g.5598 Transcript_2515/m.5598 type:complete len:348 (+) Transcript_2515:268-1311(+)
MAAEYGFLPTWLQHASSSSQLIVAVVVLVPSPVAAAAAPSLVKLGEDGVDEALELLLLVLKGVHVSDPAVAADPPRPLIDSLLELLHVLVVELPLNARLVSESALNVTEVGVQRRLGLHLAPRALVRLRVGLRLLDHVLNLILAKPSLVVLDRDLLRLAGTLLVSRNCQDAVCVNLKRHVDLGGAPRGGGDARDVELPELVAVAHHGAFPFVDGDVDDILVVGSRCEAVGLLGGDHGVAVDQLGEHTPLRLDAEGEGGHVEEEEVLRLGASLPRQDATLHSRAVSNSLVRVDALVQLLPVKVLRKKLLNLGDARRPPHQDHLVDLSAVEPRVGQRLLDGVDCALEEV